MDAPGNPLQIVLTALQVHALAEADAIAPRMEPEALLTDKRMIETLGAAGKIRGYSAEKNRKTARNILAAIHLVAALCWLNRRQILVEEPQQLPR